MAATHLMNRMVIAVGLLLVVVAASCTSDPAEQVAVGEAEPTAAPVVIVAPTQAPVASDPTGAGDSSDAPIDTPAPPAPSCSTVPTFNAADTVAVACAGGFAAAPELFASNAGWHLFQAQDGEWVEIDYAMTCCGTGEVPFTNLLERNGVDAVAIADLCLATGVGPDSVTGCSTGRGDDEPPAFEGTWLRVNGLGPHDFATTDTDVIAEVESVFGPALQVNEATECGAGSMTIMSFDNFGLQFQSGSFVGWFYEASTPALTTPSGVAPGISEPALTVAYEGVEIFDSTLGREFSFTVPAGTIGGFLDQVDGNVTSLHAGVNCFFR